MTLTSTLPLALTFARRDLRGGLRGFGILIACIAIGVAAIVGVSVLARSLSDGLNGEGRKLLGGDLSFSLLQREATTDERAWLERKGSVVSLAFMRAMGRAESGDATMVELKAVDDRYPAFGTLVTTPQRTTSDLFGQSGGLYGVAVDPALTGRLGLKVGDRLMIGTAAYQIRGEIVTEPDRIAGGIGFGPRVLMGQDGLRASGLIQPGSLARWAYRLALPGNPDVESLKAIEQQARTAFPDAGFDIRNRENAAPQMQRNLERFTQFLTLVGLTALAVGGVGVANAAAAFMDRKRLTVASLKSVGASGRLMVLTLLIEVLSIGLIGSLFGVAIGSALPFVVKAVFGSAMPVPFTPALYGEEMILGLAYGLLTVTAFALWPLGRAHDIPVSALFRDMISEDKRWPRPVYVSLVFAAAALLIGVAIVFAWDRRIAMIYAVGAGVTFLLLRLVASAIMALARRVPRPRSTEIRLALVNLHKPGSLTPSVMLSLGLGVTLLVTLGLIDFNLRNQLTKSLPEKAPSFFFIDIPAAETPDFEALIKTVAPTGELSRVPMMRGRVTALKGVRAETIKADDKVAWVLEGDRGITFSEEPPAGSRVAEGSWWPNDYAGPPLVSMEGELGHGLGLNLGDEITVNVLGRAITARIANFRKVEWQSLGINFVLVFSPNTFAGAPYANLATLSFPGRKSDDATELAVLKATAAKFPSVSSVRVKEALETIDSVVEKLAIAVRGASAIAILASAIVLGGALAAGRRTRAQEAVILKTLGATRRRLIFTMIVEYALLGAAAAIFGLLAGTVAGYGIVTSIMKLPFLFPLLTMASMVLTALIFVIIVGLAGTWRILGQKPALYLRNA